MSLEKFAHWLASKSGYWFVMIFTAACCALYFWGPVLSVMVISVIAIIIPQTILYRDEQHAKVAHARDVAMHLKLDEIIRTNRRASNELIGIEKKIDVIEGEA